MKINLDNRDASPHTRSMSKDNAVLILDTTDDDCEEVDFVEMRTTVRTPEESARVRDLRRRQDIAGGEAYKGALASGQTTSQARRAAKRARQ